MSDAANIRGHQRRANRAVMVGLGVMALALLVSSWDVVPPLATTVAAMVGLVLLMYGVHVGWLVFYEREPDGPPT